MSAISLDAGLLLAAISALCAVIVVMFRMLVNNHDGRIQTLEKAVNDCHTERRAISEQLARADAAGAACASSHNLGACPVRAVLDRRVSA